MQYSSADFDKTQASLRHQKVETPLLHQQVLDSGIRAAFSKERNHKVAVVNLPSKTISLTIGELEPLQETNLHRHNYETILYITAGEGFSLIEGERISWRAGDAVYVPVWAWHKHGNVSVKEKAVYAACENAPLLQNIGNIALREEFNMES